MSAELVEIFASALKAADPREAVGKALKIDGGRLCCTGGEGGGGGEYDLDSFSRVLVVGAGKGTAPMAEAAEEILGDRIDDGVIIVKYGHTRPLKRIRQFEASHPLPDELGVAATGELLKMLEGTDESTLVVCMLSGGASALLVCPPEGVSLTEVRSATGLLLSSGADINELNTVRKHLSRVKGGRLAEAAHPATLLTLIISDVIGDRLDTIGSGPTVPDSTTFADAVGVLKRYSLKEKVPESVRRVLMGGASGRLPDTPKGAEPFFKKTFNVIAASNREALSKAGEKARALGFSTKTLTSSLDGTARDAARRLADTARKTLASLKPGDMPVCLLSGGETTVVVTGPGRGGRNQELALAFALEIEGFSGIRLLSAGTDGTDGPTDAAGAVVSGQTAATARALGVDPVKHLDENDSYGFFSVLDELTGEKTHLKTGPTGTNVMDIQIITISK
jgi:hydroxypyruvate reductase